MVKAFIDHLQSHQILTPGHRLIVACSGGADSMALADLLQQIGFDFELAHVNYKLRGDDSDADQEAVSLLAQQLKVPVHFHTPDLQGIANERGHGIQEAARHIRYAWFELLRQSQGADAIVTAHHKDDQLESYLWHLLRGSSISGFAGIQAVSGKIVRPLLFTTKSELEEYAVERTLPYREDQSNRDPKYSRNRIRHELIPLMEDIRPGFARNIERQWKLFNEVDQLTQDFLGQLAPSMMMLSEEGLELSIEDLEELPFKRLLLLYIAKEYGFPARRVDELVNLISAQPGKSLSSSTHRIVRERSAIVISTLPAEGASRRKRNTIDESTEEVHTPIHLLIERGLKNDYTISNNPWEAIMDVKTLSFPLIIRPWEEGDRMRPLGMSGTQKLSDIFTQAKWTTHQKEHSLVVESNGEIIWCIGLRLSDKVKITDATNQVIRMRVPAKC